VVTDMETVAQSSGLWGLLSDIHMVLHVMHLEYSYGRLDVEGVLWQLAVFAAGL
jgi:hypothetical protein